MVANATTHRRANAFARALDARTPDAPDTPPRDGRAADAPASGADPTAAGRPPSGRPAPDARPDGPDADGLRAGGMRPGGVPSGDVRAGAGDPGGGDAARVGGRRARKARPGPGSGPAVASPAAAGPAVGVPAVGVPAGGKRQRGAFDPAAVPPGRGGRGRGAHADRSADASQDRMLLLANALRSLPSPAMDPDVKAAQRARLMAAVEEASAGGRLPSGKASVPEPRDGRRPVGERTGSAAARLGRLRPKSRWGRGLAVSGLAVGVAAGGLSGAAVASSDALPGDTLYGLKRSMEDLRLTMADGDADRGEVYLDMASTRLKEARRLMDRAKAGPLDDDQMGDVRKALSGMHEEAARGHDLLSKAYQRNGSLRPMEKLASFSDTQRRSWSELSPLLPEQLSQVRDNVSSVLDAIEQDVTPLRALLPVQLLPEEGRGRAGSATPDGFGAWPTEPGTPSAPSPSAPAHDGPAEEEAETPGSPSPAQTPESVPGSVGGSADDGLPVPDDTDYPGEREQFPEREITLPPLLPDLLPGLGLGGSRPSEGRAD